jgi:hypothetical protein
MHRSRRRWFVRFALVSATLAAAPVLSQPPVEKAGEKWLIDRTLTITPAAPAPPVLKYRLLPLSSELKDGNAVPIYLRLVYEQNDATRKRWVDLPKPWNELSVEQIPLKNAKEFLGEMSYKFGQLDWGARSKVADWNYTLRPGHLIELLLPDIQTMRNYAPMMVLRTRVQLAENQFADAAHSIETGFAFSRHIAEAPFLISGLVGIACGRQFVDCTTDFVGRPGAPNLYWSLVALPHPLVDLRKGIDLEYHMTELEFPDLADLDRPRTPAQWDGVLKELRTKLHLLGQLSDEGSPGKQKEWQPAGMKPEDAPANSRDLAAAKKYLTERFGTSADSVAKMPPAQVLLLAIAGTDRDLRDEFFKAAYLPYPDARRTVQAADERMHQAPETELNLLSRMMLPATLKALTAQVRLDRQLAALQVIEALRAHAATHGGQLPDSLAQVKDVPLPLDPGTGQPFEFRKDGNQVTLISRLPGEALDKAGMRYTLTVRR